MREMILESAAALCLALALIAAMRPSPLHRTPQLRVIDGDTIAIGAQRIRLTGFDAPEIRGAKCSGEKLAGRMAALRLAMMLAERGARLDFAGAKDGWGRELAALSVRGETAAAMMIREGLAQADKGHRASWCRKNAS